MSARESVHLYQSRSVRETRRQAVWKARQMCIIVGECIVVRSRPWENLIVRSPGRVSGRRSHPMPDIPRHDQSCNRTAEYLSWIYLLRTGNELNLTCEAGLWRQEVPCAFVSIWTPKSVDLSAAHLDPDDAVLYDLCGPSTHCKLHSFKTITHPILNPQQCSQSPFLFLSSSPSPLFTPPTSISPLQVSSSR